jgi:hypothetical protein
MDVEYGAGKNEQIALAFWHALSCENVRKDCYFTDILKPTGEELSCTNNTDETKCFYAVL